MKSRSLLLLFALLSSIYVSGQNFNKGSILINGGIGFGLPSYYGTISGFGVPLHLNLDYGMSDYVSVGPQIGYARYHYDYFFDQYEYTYTFTRFGARGSFHYLPLLQELDLIDIEEEKFDFYLNLNAGIESVSFNSNFSSQTFDDKIDSRFYFGPSLGFRYYPTSKIGCYLETGGGQNAWANIGVTFKLK